MAGSWWRRRGYSSGHGAASPARRCYFGSGRVQQWRRAPSIGAGVGRWRRLRAIHIWPIRVLGPSVACPPAWIGVVGGCVRRRLTLACCHGTKAAIFFLAEREMEVGLLALGHAGSVCCNVWSRWLRCCGGGRVTHRRSVWLNPVGRVGDVRHGWKSCPSSDGVGGDNACGCWSPPWRRR